MCDTQTLIIDTGTFNIKAGMAGEEEGPSFKMRPLYGVPKNKGMGLNDFYIGNDAFESRGVLNISEMIEDGIIYDYDKMRQVYEHIFNKKFHIEPEKYRCLLTESPNAPKDERLKKAQIFFENIGVNSLCLYNTLSLIAYNYSKFNCCVADCGYGKINVGCVQEGELLRHTMQKLRVSGKQVIEKLIECTPKLKSQNNYTAIDQANEILSRMCYVPLNYEEEKYNIKEKEFTITTPDGEQINLGTAVIDAPEVIFSSGYFASRINESIIKHDAKLAKEFFGNIITAGGLVRLQGFGERVKKDVSAFENKFDVNVIFNRDDSIRAAFNGASILTMVEGSKTLFITKEDYEEHGERIINRIIH